MSKMIAIADDFSKYPGGRYRKDGPYSGEAFREDVLRKELSRNQVLEIVLDGTAGYGSSFLEEAFGGLIRSGILTVAEASSRIKVVANTPVFQVYKQMVEQYLKSAATRNGAT